MLRLIARLDVKGPNLIKGVQMEGLRVIGSPNVFAKKYYLDGIDEQIYMDCVASLYGRNHLKEIIMAAAEEIFIPITVGGGIRSTDDAADILKSGADKIAINTAAVKDPELISKIARRFGSQCMVISVEAKKLPAGNWEVYTDNGRERTGLDVVEWIKKSVSKGAGEILLTSVDKEGTRKGFDLELISEVVKNIDVPLIVSGGMGKPEDLLEISAVGGIDGIAMADILHNNRYKLSEIRSFALNAGIDVRSSDET